MSYTVFDIPVWLECPFRDKVPENIEIRRGTSPDGDDMLILWKESDQKHVDHKWDDSYYDTDESRWLAPMLNMLGEKIL